MLSRMVKQVIRFRAWIVAFWVALIIVGGAAATQIESFLTTSLTIPHSQSEQAERILNSHFDENSEGLITVIYRFGNASSDEIKALKSSMSEVLSVVPNSHIVQQQALGGTLFTLLSTNQSLKESALDIEPLRRALNSAELHGAEVTGPSAIFHDVKPVIHSDLQQGQLVGVIAVSLLLVLALGLSLAAIIPLLFALSSISTVLGLLYLIAHKYLMVLYIPNIVELIGLGLAIDYSLLFIQRYRREISGGKGEEDALIRTMQSAGKTIVISSLTVSAVLATLILIPVPFLQSLGIAGFLIPVISLLAALTFLPALVAILGKKSCQSYKWTGLLERIDENSPRLNSLSDLIVRRPKSVFLTSILILSALTLPLLSLQTTPSSLTALPRNLESAHALTWVTDRVGEGVITPIQVLIDTKVDGTTNHQRVFSAQGHFVAKISKDKRVFTVASGSQPPYRNESGRFHRIFIFSKTSVGDQNTQALVRDIERIYLPESQLTKFTKVYLGGAPTQGVDLLDSIKSSLPIPVSLAVLAIFFALYFAFRSLVLPIKALLLDFISVLATLGAVSWIFKSSPLTSLFGIYQLSQLEIWALIFLTAILFGLSMDYEIFIVSHIRESWLGIGDNTQAVKQGLVKTFTLVTVAAAIFISSITGFIGGEFAGLQELGIGLAIGLIIDATIVRGLLLPSAMVLLSKWNWWPHS